MQAWKSKMQHCISRCRLGSPRCSGQGRLFPGSLSCVMPPNPVVFPANMTPRILAISGPLEGSVFFIASDLNIGRGARNHIRLDDPLVSPKHCSILYEHPNCLMHDHVSEYGTFVNDFSFPAKILAHGDHIRAGRSVFVF